MRKVSFTQIDFHLFRFINGFAKKSRILDFFGMFCGVYLALILPAVLVVLAWAWHHWVILYLPLAAGTISLALNEIVYLFYKRRRPMEMTSDNALIQKPTSPAFPSSHTSFFLSVSFVLFLFNPPVASIFLMASFLIALGRIFCGVHWPSDVAGGVVSAGIAFLIVYIIVLYMPGIYI